MLSLKLGIIAGGVVLVLGTSVGVSGASEQSTPKPPKVAIAAPKRVHGEFYNQAKYAVIRVTNFPPDTSISFWECAVPTQSDPNRCAESNWAQADGTTSATGAFTFSRKTGSGISLLGGFWFNDPDSDSCGASSGGSGPCYVTVADTSSGDTSISASVEYWSYCNHFQGYKCFPKAPHH